MTATMHIARLGLALTLPVVALACGSADQAPANVNGSYPLNITYDKNECMVADWQVGRMQTNAFTLQLTQDAKMPGQVTGKVEGLLGVLLKLTLGSDTFTGTVTGPNVEMALFAGREVMAEGACQAKADARMTGTLTGDALAGTIYLNFATNKHPDCGWRNGCVSILYYTGSRPAGR